MKIAITGASSFLGKHLVKKLSENKSNDIIALLQSKSKLQDYDGQIFECDLLDKNSLLSIPNDIDILIHLATLQETSSDKKNIFKKNAQMMKNIIDRFPNVKHLVFTSTNSAAYPISSYSTSKKKCEELLVKSGINFTIFRISPVLGSGCNSNTAKLIHSIYNGKTIPLLDKGDQIIQPIYVNDVIEAINTVLLNSTYFNKILNLTGTPISLKEFIDLIGYVLHRKTKTICIPSLLLISFVKIFSLFNNNPGVTSSQLDELNKSKILKSDFKSSSIEKAIKETLI